MLIIHNAEFDLKFLNNELKQIGMDTIKGERVTDSLSLARTIYPGQANSLDALMKRLGVEATARASFALYNTLEEAHRLVEAVRKAVTILR